MTKVTLCYKLLQKKICYQVCNETCNLLKPYKKLAGSVLLMLYHEDESKIIVEVRQFKTETFRNHLLLLIK